MRADVAVVGAGIAGAAAAHYLARGGASVVLVDRGHPGHGATGRSAGFLTSQHWSPLDRLLTRLSRALCAEVGPDGPAGIHRTGFLRVTAEAGDAPVLKERARALAAEGHRAEVLSPRKLRRRFPWMGVEGLAGGLYTPDDGYVDPYDVTVALVDRAKAAGCRLAVNRPVTSLRVEGGRVVALDTTDGPVEAKRVVVAAGAWTRPLLQTAGVDLPLKPYRVQALVTAPLPDLRGLPLFHELPDGYYLRPEREGLLVGDGTEYVEADPGSYNPEADFDLYRTLAAWLSRRVPAAAAAAVIRGWAGLCQATPDRLPLVGAVPGVERLHVLAGFNGLGIMRGPALGRALAEALGGGAPSVDLSPYRPDRFLEGEDFPIREGFTLR